MALSLGSPPLGFLRPASCSTVPGLSSLEKTNSPRATAHPPGTGSILAIFSGYAIMGRRLFDMVYLDQNYCRHQPWLVSTEMIDAA